MSAAVLAPLRRFVPGPGTVQWGQIDPSAEHLGPVAAGERFWVRTVQGEVDDPVPADWICAELRAAHAAPGPRGSGPHLLTGPIGVCGIRAGDVVAVHIERLELPSPYGFNRLRPGRGVLPSDVTAVEEVVLPFTDHGAVLAGITVPHRPFLGIVATAPPLAGGAVTSAEPGAHGGNLDCAELVAGSTLYLPAAVDGAGLTVGDGHAAQGDGEVCLTAVETCMDAVLRVEPAPAMAALDLPLAVTPAGLVTLGLGGDLDTALVAAVERLVALLAAVTDLDRRTAYRLASIAASCRVTQAVCRTKGIHAVLPAAVARQLPGRPAWLDHEAWR